MQATQLELNLWDELEQAAAEPEQVDLNLLWKELEQLLAGLPHEQKLHTAGKAIEQIAEGFALRSDFILSAWEEAHNEEGPAVDEDVIGGLVRQTMNLDLSELLEEPVAEHRQRQPHASATESVAGPVDKATLLEAFDTEIEVVEAEAQRQSGALITAHEEDVSGWAGAIARWFAQRAPAEPVSLLQLQEHLGLPMVEVWMGLLLSQPQQYQLEQRGEFYQPQGLWLQTSYSSSV